MKKRVTGLLMAVALLSIAVAGIGKANAYFTTYAQAYGQKQIRLGDQTTIEEEFEDWKKSVTISNNADSDQPVYVRAIAFGPEEYTLAYSGTNWVKDGDYYYYRDSSGDIALQPGASTEKLVVEIKDVPKAKEDPEKKDFNVVVVYETTLSDWTGDIITTQS